MDDDKSDKSQVGERLISNQEKKEELDNTPKKDYSGIKFLGFTIFNNFKFYLNFLKNQN